MRNKLIVLVLAFMTVLLVSCKDENRDYVNFYVWGDSIEISRYERIAKDFEKQEGITVKIIPATGDYYDNLNIYLGSKNNAPDLFFTEQGEILSQLSTDRVLDLTPYIESKELDVQSESNPDGKIALWDINDGYRFDGTEFGKGSYYALIKDWSPDFIMWYNKNHIDTYNLENNFKKGDPDFMEYPSEEVPLSWSEFLDLSHKLTITEGNQTLRYGTMLDRVPWKHFFQMIQATGNDVFNEGKYFNAEDEGVIKAFEFFSSLQAGEKASSPKIGPTGIGSGEAFANGNLSIAWFGSWAYSAFNFDNVSFDLGIAPPPVPDKNRELTEEDNYGVTSGMIGLAINNRSPVKSETIKFLNYYMTTGSEFMAKYGFNIPGNKLIAESDIYLKPESSELRKINQYFYNFANKYTHLLQNNKYISQLVVENQIDKNFSTWITNYNPNTIKEVLKKIAGDIKNEID